MGRLYGFKYKQVIKKLRRAGFEFDRYAKGSHEIWRNPETGRRTTVPNHPGALPEGTLRAIIKQAGIEDRYVFSTLAFQNLPKNNRPETRVRWVKTSKYAHCSHQTKVIEFFESLSGTFSPLAYV